MHNLKITSRSNVRQTGNVTARTENEFLDTFKDYLESFGAKINKAYRIRNRDGSSNSIKIEYRPKGGFERTVIATAKNGSNWEFVDKFTTDFRDYD